LGLPRPVIIITPRKSGGGLELGDFPKILGFPYNISATAELVTSNMALGWGSPMPIMKSHAEERVGMALG